MHLSKRDNFGSKMNLGTVSVQFPKNMVTNYYYTPCILRPRYPIEAVYCFFLSDLFRSAPVVDSLATVACNAVSSLPLFNSVRRLLENP